MAACAWRFEAIALVITPMRADGNVIKPRSSCDRTRAADALPYDLGLLEPSSTLRHVPGLSRKKAPAKHVFRRNTFEFSMNKNIEQTRVHPENTRSLCEHMLRSALQSQSAEATALP